MIFYLNNYRGFDRTFIKTTDVNILLGENSTGKSSFMSIVSLLSDPEFLIQGQFKNSYIDLGPFNEIISVLAKTKRINIGVIKTGNDSLFDKRFLFKAIYLTFDSKAGYPDLFEVALFAGNTILHIKYFEGSLKYSIIRFDKAENNIDSIKELFESWSGTGQVSEESIKTGEINLAKTHTLPQFLKKYLLTSVFVVMESLGVERNKYLADFDEIKYATDSIIYRTQCMAPIRSKPQRIYEPELAKYSVDGTHIPSVLRDIYLNFETKPAYKKIINTLEDFGRASGLFDRISVNPFDKNDELSPFYLNIELYKRELKISNVGYGISQILPILTEILRRPKDCVFLIQQPEIHLHPKAQAFFGEFIMKEYMSNRKNFIIETHSDYFVDRMRINIRKSRRPGINAKISILFFENTPAGNKVTRIELDKNGDYSPDQPKSFREFFLNEERTFLGF